MSDLINAYQSVFWIARVFLWREDRARRSDSGTSLVSLHATMSENRTWWSRREDPASTSSRHVSGTPHLLQVPRQSSSSSPALACVCSFPRDQHRAKISKSRIEAPILQSSSCGVLPPNVEDDHRWRLEALTFALRPSPSFDHFAFGVFGLGYGTVCACACSISHPPPPRRRATTTLNRPRHDAPRERRSPRPNRASRLTDSCVTGGWWRRRSDVVLARATRRRSQSGDSRGNCPRDRSGGLGCEHPCVCVRVDRRRRQPCWHTHRSPALSSVGAPPPTLATERRAASSPRLEATPDGGILRLAVTPNFRMPRIFVLTRCSLYAIIEIVGYSRYWKHRDNEIAFVIIALVIWLLRKYSYSPNLSMVYSKLEAGTGRDTWRNGAFKR